jgi:hypothetical protein
MVGPVGTFSAASSFADKATYGVPGRHAPRAGVVTAYQTPAHLVGCELLLRQQVTYRLPSYCAQPGPLRPPRGPIATNPLFTRC